MKNAWTLPILACALVIGVYVSIAQPGVWESLTPNAADAYYNLLVDGFRAGQLNLKKEVPPGLAQLANPYDLAAGFPYRSALYRLHDLSYYKGRLYLYWGITPALILFWPFVALSGEHLFHRQAVIVFCAIGFLTSAGLLHAMWRRYFTEVSVAVVAACVLAVGLATGIPTLLARADVYEVAISCGYMLTMLALTAIWRAWHEPERRGRWLAAASLAYGLAVGARPNLLFGAVILLGPVLLAWRERRRAWTMLLAATVPITLIGLGLMLYNARRFDSPFEFGQHYQMSGEQMASARLLSPHYVWFNFRMYFLQPARWATHFPFVRPSAAPSPPPGYGNVERIYGALGSIPVVWLALAAPLAWRDRSGQVVSILRSFVASVTLLFGICALTLSCYWWVSFRYETEFLPALVLLAVVGILGLDRALINQLAWRRAARWAWGLLLAVSVTFNLLAGVRRYGEAHSLFGFYLAQLGRVPEATAQFEQALRFDPDDAEAHCNLGVALGRAGKVQEAIEHLSQAVRIKPDYAEAHMDLGIALASTGRAPEAIEHFKQALRINPGLTEAQTALAQLQAKPVAP